MLNVAIIKFRIMTSCNFQQIAVIIRNLTATFKICNHVTATFKIWSHNSKCHCKMLKVAVIIRNLIASFEICIHVTATFNILQSEFEMGPQNVESCSHNSKCDCKILKVAVIIRNVTATFNILQSDFEICIQVKCDCNFSKSTIT